jgi:hypothetical protein
MTAPPSDLPRLAGDGSDSLGREHQDHIGNFQYFSASEAYHCRNFFGRSRKEDCVLRLLYLSKFADVLQRGFQ